jgi:peptidoglycan L-alanyl-D-glutamate endopeptidase CwlK
MELKVTSLYPKIADALPLILNEAKARKLAVDVHSAIRTPGQQDELYAQGRTKPGEIVTYAKGFESWHCLGLAVDIVFKPNGMWTWNVSNEDWENLGKIGELFGLEWGGRWQKIKDFPHFQLRPKLDGSPLAVKVAAKIAQTDGLEKLWAMV